ncbi:zinc finger protein, putative [Entamoeba dispar SAW760]|uniref:Zinc finger protein, putative n=1 Tax=Entamoeba dispar (strain ATCC PRA-260 / SAW760) TaxID=370354 RepID=B0E6U8_ENTDS|nr:zinc finger protein, putative [Entamoeba dispar SAW760]EDR29689.1 zinc finger protein, putative [Entamoeba dispar SAW760]|eukprot:EDR29689.1 zinc finger protein, putative [Entamoeba dispar SAW760]
MNKHITYHKMQKTTIVDGVEITTNLFEEEIHSLPKKEEYNSLIITQTPISQHHEKEEDISTISDKDNENEKKPIIKSKNKKLKKKEVKNYICSVCGHKCNTNGALVSHKRIHDPNSKKYSCPECGKKFRTMAEVRRHSVTHTGDKKFICPIENCRRCFTTKSYLDKHIESHKTNQTYQCTYYGCNNSFFMKSELIAHVKEKHQNIIGNKNAAFCCPYEGCTKAFEYPSHLFKHCAAQHQKNDFVCGFENCYETFNREELLWEHISSIHGMDKEKYQEERIECPKCGVIVLKRTLQQHMRKAHTEKSICFKDDGTIITDEKKRWFECCK